MRLSKKFLLIGILCVVLVAGTLGGFAIASADDEESTDTARPGINQTELMEKVAEIYERNTGTAIDPEELQNAFNEARTQVMTDAHDEFLQSLVDEGKITQEQADEWKAWLDARPDTFSDEFKEWLESRPDIPELSGSGRFGGFMPLGEGRHGSWKIMGEGHCFSFGGYSPDSTE